MGKRRGMSREGRKESLGKEYGRGRMERGVRDKNRGGRGGR